MVIDITVITPMYNAEKYIAECITSVFSQGFENIEHIIVDDNSTDNSKKIVEILALEYPNIKLLGSSSNRGPAGSRNQALSIAQGRLICFLDADDIWAEGKLAKQMKIAERKEFPIIAGGYVRFDEHKNHKFVSCRSQKIGFDSMKYSNWIYTSSVMVDKGITGDFRMREDLYYDDYACWVSLIRDYGPAYYIKGPLMYYRVVKSSVSRNKVNSAIKTLEIYREVFKFNLIQKMFYFPFYLVNGLLKS